MFRRLTLLTLAAAALAGCGAPALPGAAGVAAAGKLAAKGLTPEAAEQLVGKAVAPAMPLVALGVQAVLRAPSDAWAQRGLGNLYDQAVDRVLPTIPAEVDESIWPRNMANFQKQYPAVTDPEVLAYVQGVADRLAKAGGQAKFKVFVCDVPWADAFNAGGHAMMIYTGLLRDMQDEAELAAVMGHEMGHGMKRHMLGSAVGRHAAAAAVKRSAELNQPSDDEMQLVASYVASLEPGQQHDADFVLAHVQDKVGAETLAHLRLIYNGEFARLDAHRGQEAESDLIGARLNAAAGYDPLGGARAFARWNGRGDGDTRYYDHPALGSRVGAIKEAVARLGLKGDDKGAERLAAIKAKLAPAPARAEAYVRPADAAGAGCVHGAAWQPLKFD